MAPSPSAEPVPEEPAGHDVDVLFVLADRAIRAGLEGDGRPHVEHADLPATLRRPRGAFVTLEVAGRLNGCIGALDPGDPLGVAVPRLAWEAAFADPRLPPLTPAGYDQLTVKLSLLGPLTPVPAGSEEDVVAAVRPGVDGLVIAAGPHQATFLPAVWDSLPDPHDFLRHLERKAGLVPGQWPPARRVWRYTVSEHRRSIAEIRRLAATVRLSAA